MAPAGRRPGESGTRERIRQAARETFAEVGYHRARMRTVAERAGVDPSLIYHFFGSKAELFVAVLDPPFDPRTFFAPILEGNPDEIGDRFVRALLASWAQPGGREPVVALVRSAVGDPDAAAALRDVIAREWLAPLVKRLGSSDADLRATLVGTQVMGLVMGRYILKIEPIASADPELLVRAIGPTLQRYLLGELS